MKRAILTSVSTIALFAAAPALAQNNTATVTQDGLAQQAEVIQTNTSGSDVTGDQQGADNWTVVRQGAGGENNTVTINQDGADVPPTGVPQSEEPYSQQLSNIADVTQNGDNGSVEVDQTGNNRAQVHQAYAPGEGQSAIIDQETVPGDGTENYAATHQRGNDLSADTTPNGGNKRGIVSQKPSGNAATSYLQHGNSKKAGVTQRSEEDREGKEGVVTLKS